MLISLYKVEDKRIRSQVLGIEIDEFVLSQIPGWVFHYKSIRDKCDVVMCYEEMREDPYREFSRLFAKLGIEFQEDILRKSIDISRFDNIKQMGRRTKQQYGSHHPFTFKGEFTRSGEVRQYVHELKQNTVKKCQAILFKNEINIEL